MARVSVPYFKWRDGRPRWEPGPGLRRAGFKGQDLRDSHGRWLERGPAIAAAEVLNKEVAAWKAGHPQTPREQPTITSSPRSCKALAEKYFESVDFTRLGIRTQSDYRNKLAVFLESDFGEVPVSVITKPDMVDFWQEMYDTRGHAMAVGVHRCVSLLFSYAELVGWRREASNPAFNLKRPSLKPRVAIFEPRKAEAMVETADRLGFHSVGDAIVIALHSCQRLSDVLAMPERIFDEQRLRLTQFKTNALVDAPMTPQLLARVRQVRARRASGAVVRMPQPDRPLVICEDTGQPYRANESSAFNRRYRAVRDAACKADPTLEQSARFAPGLHELRFQDTRDTGVTRLAMAGCTLPQIAAISGHSPPHITAVIKHYLALNNSIADDAIRLLTAWLEQNRIAV